MRAKLPILFLLLAAGLFAVWFFGVRQPTSPLRAVLQGLDDSSPQIRRQAEADLRNLGAGAVPELLDWLAHTNEPPLRAWLRRHLPAKSQRAANPRAQAIHALELLGPLAESAAPAMITRLESRRFPQRTANVLIAIGPGAVPAILGALRTNTDPLVKAQLLGILGDMGTNNAAAVPEILARVADANPGVRAAAAMAIGKIRAQPAVAVPDLQKLMSDDAPAVRCAAASALGEFGSPASVAVPELLQAVYDARPEVRRAAALALLRMDDQHAALEALTEVAKDREQDNRAGILVELARREVPENTLAELCDLLKKDPDVSVRRNLLKLIKDLSPEPRSRIATALLSDPEQEIRIVAGEMLGRCIGSTPAAEPAVSQALHEADYTGRLALLGGLARAGTNALPQLCEALTNDLPGVRRQAAFFLGTFGGDARPAIRPLALALDDYDHNVRLDALHALQRIDKELAPVPAEKALSEADEQELIAKVKAAAAKAAQP